MSYVYDERKSDERKSRGVMFSSSVQNWKTENRKEKFWAKIVRNYLLKFNSKLQTINLDVVLSRIEPIFKFFLVSLIFSYDRTCEGDNPCGLLPLDG